MVAPTDKHPYENQPKGLLFILVEVTEFSPIREYPYSLRFANELADLREGDANLHCCAVQFLAVIPTIHKGRLQEPPFVYWSK